MRHYKYWIALEQTKGIGPVHLRDIHRSLSSLKLSIRDLFELSSDEIEAELSLGAATARAIGEAANTLSLIEDDYFAMMEAGVSVLMFFEEHYPSRLAAILKNEYPPILYTLGNREILSKKGAAVLGEMGVSPKGELIAYLAAKQLCERRIPVISGFARGADMIAHRSALENGGQTVAVLPCGMGHLKIPDTIKESYDPDNMVIVSPFFHNREFSPYLAMRRNRVVCALSLAVLIVESPPDGGVFEAGKSAKNLGIPLYTVEYSQYPDSARGNPVLIQEMGATPVRGRMVNDLLTPNIDRLIGDVKFS